MPRKRLMENTFDAPKSNVQFSEGQKSKGILDDYATRLNLNAKSAFIEDEVGVGTTAPTGTWLGVKAKVEVKTQKHSTLAFHTTDKSQLTILGFITEDNLKWAFSSRNEFDAPNNRFSIHNNDGVAEVFTILQNGNIGIGTITPGDKLHVLDTRTDNESAALFIQHTGSTPSGASYGMVIEKTGASSRTNVGGSFSASGADNNYGLIVPNGKVGIGTSTPTTKFSVMEKSGMTPIGGIAIKLTNKTGANSIAGQLVRADTANNDAVKLTSVDEEETIGVFLDAGISDGSEAWVVVSGIADVAMEDNTTATRGNWVRTSTTVGEEGYADATNATPPSPAAFSHFNEIGNCIETVTATGIGTHVLARCVLHFN